MGQKIVFQSPHDGTPCVCFPISGVEEPSTLLAIALQSVPLGAPFKIVDVEIDPASVDLSSPDGHGEGSAWEPAQPQPVPPTISDRQFFQALALLGLITEADALEAVKVGTIPATLQGLVDQLPAEQRFAAEMILSGATIFERNHPMTLALAASMGWTDEQLDALWRDAALL